MSIDHGSALGAAGAARAAAPRANAVSHEWGGATRGAEFLTSAARTARCRELADDGYLVARVVPVFDRDDGDRADTSMRSSELRNHLEGAVEISLALRGALPPSVDIGSPVEESVDDQIYRLQKLGARGLCLVLPELRRIADSRGRLSADDSAALEAWRLLSDDHPVVLLLDDGDKSVTMLAPRKLETVFAPPRPTPTSWPDDARSLLDQTPTDRVAVALTDDGDLDQGWDDSPVIVHTADASPMVAAPVEKAVPNAYDEDAAQDVKIEVHDSLYEAPTRPGKRLMATDPLAGLDLDGDSHPGQDGLADGDPVQRSLFGGPSNSDRGSSRAPSKASRSRGGRSVQSRHDSAPPRRPRLPPAEIDKLCRELEAAQGPKPVSAIQELFRTHYTPLLEVLSDGFDDPHVERVVDDWRESFEKSYGEGFNTMRVTGRRPPMVLDAPEIASKIAKQSGARAAQLLLVDGMRYDLGQRVQRELAQLLDGQAVCVEQPVLWSALPSVTPVQMHLLARGARALKEEPHSEREPTIQREGSLTTLRRVRIGQRDLVKLDLVEARLREAGPGFESRMSALAEEVADVIAAYAEGLPPRTLLFVFGDHGFYMPTGGPDATGPADQGNATPEEVLIGAQAWMIGAVN